MDLELELFGDLKESGGAGGGGVSGVGVGSGAGGSGSGGHQSGGSKSSSSVAVGRIFMLSLSSQPVDHEDATGRTKVRRNLKFSNCCSCIFLPSRDLPWHYQSILEPLYVIGLSRELKSATLVHLPP